MFKEIKGNIILCLNSNEDSYFDNIISQLSSKKCPINDCSMNWKDKKRKIIEDKNICIDDCKNDDTYKYEYEYYCYDKCPKETHSLKNNIYFCEKNVNECVANYPFINVKDNSCLEECISEDFFNDICKINNIKSYKLIQSKIISSIIKDIQDGSLNKLLNERKKDIIKREKDILYQITSTFNQNNKEYQNISKIKLDECENILKENYNISKNEYLIVFKIERYFEEILIPLIEYELFNPTTNEKLNLTYCINNNKNIYLNIPIFINENISMKYDPNNAYYKDICYPYTTEQGTDISLYDRKKEFNNYYSICPNNCIYTEYNSSNNNVICKCEIKNGISLTPYNNKSELLYQFLNLTKSTNIDIFKCYKLLFTKEGLIINIGNYIIIIIIIIFLISAIFFYFKEYNLICHQINDLLNSKITEIETIKDEAKEKSTDIFSTSKKSKISSIKNNSNKYNFKKKFDIEISVNDNKSNNNTYIEKTMEYLDYEINSIPFNEAYEIDKRTFFQYYISLIKTNHILIFTFNKVNDYNSFIIKICLLLFYLALYLIVNTLFFNESTIHQIYIDKGTYNFRYILPQILYSIIISSFFVSIVRRIALTQNNILEIKHEKNKCNLNARVSIALKKIKIKFISFFTLCFLFLLIFWYFLSCFCAVLRNTQIYLIKTTLLSYLISFIYPFIIYLLPGLFRIFSFKQPGECLYKISQIIQIF